jgi:fatty acid amide hydrolase
MSENLQEILIYLIEPLLKITPKQFFIGLFLSIGGVKVAKYIKNKIRLQKINKIYRIKAKEFRTKRDEKLKKFHEENNNLFDNFSKHEITHASLCDLKNLLDNGKYTSETIVKVLLLRNYEYLKYNYAADINVEETIRLAKKADEIRKNIIESKDNNKMLQYPLLGLPLSFKDVFLIKKFQMTQGYAVNLDLPVGEEDSYIVKILKEKGAIPLIISSIPQGISAIENQNLIFGQAVNPYNPKRIIGGSSGGEAGLISNYCSAAGIGSDIGGSIRIPCNFCGIYGFKPTASRISKLGTLEDDNNKTMSPFHLMRVSYGPMSRTLDDIIYLSQNIIGNYEKDCRNFNVPFDNQLFSSTYEKKRFKVAILKSSLCKLTEPVQSTLDIVIEGLKKNKQNIHFDIEEFPFKKYSEFVSLIYKLLYASRKIKNIFTALKGEYEMDHLSNLKQICNLNTFTRKICSFLLWITFNKRMKFYFDISDGNIGLKEYLEDIKRVEELKNEFVSIYQQNDYDVIISPIFPLPAIKHSHSKELMIFIDYPFIFNILDFPSGVIPIRKCGKQVNKYDDNYNDMFTKKIIENLEDCEGLPIGIQVSTLSNLDETCLGIMKVIDDILRIEKIKEEIRIVDN